MEAFKTDHVITIFELYYFISDVNGKEKRIGEHHSTMQLCIHLGITKVDTIQYNTNVLYIHILLKRPALKNYTRSFLTT